MPLQIHVAAAAAAIMSVFPFSFPAKTPALYLDIKAAHLTLLNG